MSAPSCLVPGHLTTYAAVNSVLGTLDSGGVSRTRISRIDRNDVEGQLTQVSPVEYPIRYYLPLLRVLCLRIELFMRGGGMASATTHREEKRCH